MSENENNEIVIGSISDIAQKSGTDIATTFMQATVVCIYDCSGSMSAHDDTDESRHERAKKELIAIQEQLPGEVGLICFSNKAEFIANGYPVFYGDTTDLAGALQLARIADEIEGMRFIVISDGYPDHEGAALDEAEKYQNKIDVIYIGSESTPVGRSFLEQLAKASGGKAITAEIAKELGAGIMTLLGEGK